MHQNRRCGSRQIGIAFKPLSCGEGHQNRQEIKGRLGAGEEKLIPFKLAKENKQPVAFTTKYKMVSM